MKNKFIKRGIVLAGVAIFLFSIAVYAYAVTLRSYNTQAQEFMGKGEISLTDSYDSESSRVSDFLKEDHCQEILDDTYHSLITNRKIDYYEVLPQPIEYVGEYKGSGVSVDENESATRVRGVLIILAVVFSFLLCKKTHERSEEIHRWTN